MNKKHVVIILGVVLIIIIIFIVILNHYISIQREFELNNTPDQLEGVLGNCACQERIRANPETNEACTQELIDWQNSTHYIDNNVCKFLEIRDGFVIPIDAYCPNAMIAVDGKCMPLK